MTFRIQYKDFGLTYSRCPIPRETLIELLREKIQITDFYVAQETHKEDKGCPYHLHVWFEAAAKPNIRKPDYFDLKYEDKVYHPNIGKKKRNWIYNYLKKQDTEPYTNIADGYIALAKAGNTELALEKFSQDHPREFVINYERIKNTRALLWTANGPLGAI